MALAARAWVAEHYDDRVVLGLVVDFYMNLIRPAAIQNPQAEEEGRAEVVTGLPASL
jgi:hypothetical protein